MTEPRKEIKSASGSLVICICGLAGSGKSTVAKRLAKKYGLKYYSGGDALKALAAERGCKPSRSGWWESEEGLRFLEERRTDQRFDQAIDRKFLEIARQGNVVLDSWTMPWLLDKGFKIWLDATLENRARRVAKRDGVSTKDALKALRSKETKTKEIYKRLYGFSLGEDYAPFNFVLDTDCLSSSEVFQVLCMVVENCLVRSRRN